MRHSLGSSIVRLRSSASNSAALREGVRWKGSADYRIYSLLYRESRSTALAIRALALEDVGAIRPVLVAAPHAPQHADVLVMVRAGEVGSPDHDLPVSVPVARLGRPLTHGGQYINRRTGDGRSLGCSKPP